MRHALLAFCLLATALPASAQSPTDTAYNKAVMRATVLDKLGDAMVTSMQMSIENNDIPGTCSALGDSLLNWNNALLAYQVASDTPADARDTDRLAVTAIQDETDFIHQKIAKAQTIFNTYCKV